jgi:DNA-binding transcriptional MocR family regulator
MTIEPADLGRRPGPRYRALADALADAVQSGRLQEGARLPTQRELAYRLGITVGTVGRAYELVEQRGLIACEVGRGSYVRGRNAGTPPLHVLERPGSETTDLRINAPSPLALDSLLAEGLAELARSKVGVELLRSYAPGCGMTRHREAGARWLSGLGVSTAAERVVITGGAQNGLHLALSVLTSPGDVLLVEQIAYPGLRDLAHALRLRIEPVAMDEHGLAPDALTEAAQESGGRVVVIVPDQQNPTTIQMPEFRRIELAEAARRTGLWIIEDAVYRPLAGAGSAALASLAPERVVHVASFSKGVLPGLRLGLLSAPGELVPTLARAVHAFRVGESPLMGELMRLWVERGLLDEAVRAQRAEAAARQRLVASSLTDVAWQAQATSLHLWLQLPSGWRPTEAERALESCGVLIAPADLFWFGRGAAPAALRLAIGRPETRGRLEQALAQVAGVLQSTPVHRGAVV